MDKFTYLVSTLSRNIIDDEVNARLAGASAAFGRLHNNLWNRRGITLETKVKVYRTVVLTTLLYGCESWMVYESHAKKLSHFHTTCLRKLLGIKWQDKIPDTEVLRRASSHSFAGQGMYFACQTIGFLRDCCILSYLICPMVWLTVGLPL